MKITCVWEKKGKREREKGKEKEKEKKRKKRKNEVQEEKRKKKKKGKVSGRLEAHRWKCKSKLRGAGGSDPTSESVRVS